MRLNEGAKRRQVQMHDERGGLVKFGVLAALCDLPGNDSNQYSTKIADFHCSEA